MFDDSDEEFQKLVREAFAIEASELLQSLTSGLRDLEQSPEPDQRATLVTTIHRNAHSLKGASATVGRNDISRICLALEGIFAKWRTSPPAGSADGFGLIHRAIDHLGTLLKVTGPELDPKEQMQTTQIANALTVLGSAA